MLIVPWTSFWDWKLLEGALGFFTSLLRNNYVRGAISAVGLLSLRIGLIEALFVTGILKPEVEE